MARSLSRRRFMPLAAHRLGLGEGESAAAPDLSAESLEQARRQTRRDLPAKAAAVIAAAVLAFIIQGLARNQAVQWPTVGRYLFAAQVLEGVGRTLLITVAAIAVAVVLGSILAVMRLSANQVLKAVNAVYVWFFRSIPLLVLLILSYNFSLLYAHLSLGLPFGPEFVRFSTKDAASGLAAATITFGLQQAAYTSEVIRAAIISVPAGQVEAANALGMTGMRALRRVVFPQAARIAIPPVANETINLCKSTSLVAFISVPDLLYSVQEIYSQDFQVVPLLVVATLWYVAIVSALSIGQWLLERHLHGPAGRAGGHQAGEGP
jgi:polar amino acid transport system permease protein